METFTQKVYAYIKTIPKGEVRTYKQVAEAIGSPRAFRAVGSALKKNFDPAVPCHRVIPSNGTLGEYNRGREEKRRKLADEGFHRA